MKERHVRQPVRVLIRAAPAAQPPELAHADRRRRHDRRRRRQERIAESRPPRVLAPALDQMRILAAPLACGLERPRAATSDQAEFAHVPYALRSRDIAPHRETPKTSETRLLLSAP